MTEKSARNPTPGSFPHTGSAPATPPVRGQRGATSAERGAEPRGRGAAAEAPAGLRGGGGAGEGGEAGGARRRPPYDRSWRADRGGARPARRSNRAETAQKPRSADGAAAGSAARPRAAGGGEAPSGESSAGESLPGVAPQPCRQPPRAGQGGPARSSAPAAEEQPQSPRRRGAAVPGRRGCLPGAGGGR